MAFANLSVKIALEEFGKKVQQAIEEEFLQLFVTKKALKVVPWAHLNIIAQDISVISSRMFLKEKYGKLDK